jgi:hypothetical protein
MFENLICGYSEESRDDFTFFGLFSSSIDLIVDEIEYFYNSLDYLMETHGIHISEKHTNTLILFIKQIENIRNCLRKCNENENLEEEGRQINISVLKDINFQLCEIIDFTLGEPKKMCISQNSRLYLKTFKENLSEVYPGNDYYTHYENEMDKYEEQIRKFMEDKFTYLMEIFETMYYNNETSLSELEIGMYDKYSEISVSEIENIEDIVEIIYNIINK